MHSTLWLSKAGNLQKEKYSFVNYFCLKNNTLAISILLITAQLFCGILIYYIEFLVDEPLNQTKRAIKRYCNSIKLKQISTNSLSFHFDGQTSFE